MIFPSVATDTPPCLEKGDAAWRLITRGDRPVARLLNGDADKLAAYELLSMVLEPGLGHERAHAAAIRLLCSISGEDVGPLRRIGRATPQQLQEIGGLTPAAAARLLAALELGRRFASERVAHRCRITAAEDVYERFHTRLRDLTTVEYWVLAMNDGHEVVNEVMVSRGSESAPVHCRDVFRPVLLAGVRRIVLVHNDPSATRRPRPSDGDRDMTVDIAEAAAAVGLVLWDHVVIGVNGYLSYKDAGLLTARRRKRRTPEGTS